MRAIKQLKDEHEGIKLMLRVLEILCQKLEKGEELNTKHFLQVIDFLKIFIDKCHNNKEEEFLFPALEKAGIPLEGGPIGVMLMEHDTGRGYVENMSEAFLEYNAGNNASHKKIIENARNYIKLLTEHIQKENEYLFDMADKYLSPDRQEELIREFDRIEDKKIGEGKYEECRNIMKEVNKIYLEKG